MVPSVGVGRGVVGGDVSRRSFRATSRKNQKIYWHIEAWRNRAIEGDFPYVYLDGVVLKRSWAGEVRNISVLVAIGVGTAVFGKFSAMLRARRRIWRAGAASCGTSKIAASKVYS